MNAMGYLKRIGRGVKAMGSGGGSSQGGGDSVGKLAGGVAKEIGGLFKKKKKATATKEFDSGKPDEY